MQTHDYTITLRGLFRSTRYREAIVSLPATEEVLKPAFSFVFMNARRGYSSEATKWA